MMWSSGTSHSSRLSPSNCKKASTTLNTRMHRAIVTSGSRSITMGSVARTGLLAACPAATPAVASGSIQVNHDGAGLLPATLWPGCLHLQRLPQEHLGHGLRVPDVEGAECALSSLGAVPGWARWGWSPGPCSPWGRAHICGTSLRVGTGPEHHVIELLWPVWPRTVHIVCCMAATSASPRCSCEW
jgi:hypothetical protein